MKTSAPTALSAGTLSPVERALVDGRDAGRDDAVDGNSLSGTDGHGFADANFVDGNVELASVANDMRDRGAKIEDATNGRLGAIERIPLDAFAAQGDEDDEGGRHLFAQNNGRQSRDRQGQVGSDPSFEQPFERLIEDPAAAEHRRQEGQPKTERLSVS